MASTLFRNYAPCRRVRAQWPWPRLLAAMLLAVAFVSPVARGGIPFSVDGWTTEDGLPQNSVISLAQTHDGYLWLGTLNGLVRFDGLRFTIFDENNTPGLNSSRIVHIFEDSRKRLWIGTETAGFAVATNDQALSVGPASGRRDSRLVSACEDANGTVWLYTADGQLWRFGKNDERGQLVSTDHPSQFRALMAEKDGPVWVGTDGSQAAINPSGAAKSMDQMVDQELPVGRLDCLLASRLGGYWKIADGRVQKWKLNRLERDIGPSPWGLARVSAACEDLSGNLIVGTLGAGVFWFDESGASTCLSTNSRLAHSFILSLLMDREGALWVGTDGGGLNRVKPQVFNALESTRGWVAQTVCADAKGGLWIGSNGDGAGYWKDGVLTRYGSAQGLFNSYVRSLHVDRNHQVWAGTYGAGLFQLRDERFAWPAGGETIPPVVLAIHEDAAGRLWIGTQNGLVVNKGQGWHRFTTTNGLSSDVVQALADAPGGGLWIGTVGGGLNLLQDGRFKAYRKKDGLPSDEISCLLPDTEGVLWIGTFGGGLARWQSGHVTRFSTREGLISNSIGYLLADAAGNLWIGSNAGLMRVRKRDLDEFARKNALQVPCRVFGRTDGLPTRECTTGSQPAAALGPDGQLWFPTIKGVVSVNPAMPALQPNPHPPSVVIESVLINGQALDTRGIRPHWPGVIIIPPGKERLEIHYTSLNLAAPALASFKYRLDGYDKEWTESGRDRVARFPKLPAGGYSFQVTACNEDGVWNNQPTALAILVETPFWRTWWFLGGLSLALIGVVAGAVHYVSTQKLQRQIAHLHQQEALERDRARIAQDIHDQLGANLTQIAMLGELAETDKDLPQEVEGHARQITQAARDTTRVLDEIVWAVNPSNDTFDGLVTYVCKYAQEYLAIAGLRYRLDVPTHLPSTPITPELRHNVFLVCKESVNNIVKHAQAGSVWLRLRVVDKAFTLEIQDDGRGLAHVDPKAAAARNGMSNMRKRAAEIGATFSIGPAPDKGTLVQLTVPVAAEVTSRSGPGK